MIRALRLYDQQGNYRGKLSANPAGLSGGVSDPNNMTNETDQIDQPSASLNNQFGAGNPFRSDSPNNPYGKGWRIEGGK